MTLVKVMKLARNYAGMQDMGALSDVDLIDAVNDYYRFTLPNEATFDELVHSYTIDVEPGQSTYSLSQDVISLKNPRLLDPDNSLLSDINFFDRLQERQGEPTAAMVLNGKIFFNPTPDTAYVAQFVAYTRPDALNTSQTALFRDDIDDLVAVGTAKLLLNRQGDIERATALTGQYNSLRANAMSGTYRASLEKTSRRAF